MNGHTAQFPHNHLKTPPKKFLSAIFKVGMDLSWVMWYNGV